MATNETLENQAHEAGDDSYSNKFINRDGETTIDHLADKRQDIGGHQLNHHQQQQQQQHEQQQQQQQQLQNYIEKGTGSMVEETNGQPETTNAMNQSTDITETTNTTSTSTPNSPPQSEQHKQDGLYENDVVKAREDHDDRSSEMGENRNSANKIINRNNIVDNDDHDGDDEDEGNDEDLEEGELKDDDDDDDDDEDDNNTSNNRFSSSNDNNNNNASGLTKDSSAYSDSRHHNDSNSQNNPSNYGGPPRPYNQPHHHHHHHNRRHFSPNQQHHPGMHHPQFPPYQHQFPGANNNNYRFPPGHEGGMPPMMMPQMNHHPAGPGDIYGPRGGPVNVGPVQKVNVKCRYYSKTVNKCTWGEQCRFRHREDSPSMNEGFDDRPPGPEAVGPAPGGRGPPPAPTPMGAAERFHPTPPMPHQPYGYGPPPYEHHPQYGPHQSASPPLHPHSMPPHHWRQQLSPYAASSASSAHHPESVSPALLSHSGAPSMAPNSTSGNRVPPSQQSSGSSTSAPPVAPSPGCAPSPGYSSSPSSSAVYERKFRLAYESAPWNDRGYPQPSRYDRNDPASGYPPQSSRGGYYRNHYSRDPYGREPVPPHHMGGAPYNYPSGYPPNYPSGYRGGPPPGGPPYSSHYRYSSSSQRTASSDARQLKSNKRARDGESSWSDSGSEDSLLNQAGTSSKGHSSKINKKYHRTSTQATTEDPDLDTSAAAKDDVDQGGSGTPPGEPLTEDKERQELLLEKLREIEDLMAKKKKEEDSL